MSFQSIKFIIFLLIIFLCYWKMSPKYRWILLLAAGYLFYMSWGRGFVFLLFGITFYSYIAAHLIQRTKQPFKKYVLTLSVVLEIGILFLYKYLGFFTQIVNELSVRIKLPMHIEALNLLLPVGISFYIFQTIAYLIDVYKEKITAEKHFGYYAQSVAFFPILLSGPIERIQNLILQFRAQPEFDEENAKAAFQRILFGYLKKMIIADSLAVYVNQIYGDLHSYSGVALLMVILIYSIEIYCDFSGYSDIAIGVAGLFGIQLHPNFERPYFADSITDFWRRWHISLTSWFRDYVYIPLGGNRRGTGKRDRNLIVTFLLSGLWHGAGWTFMVWGALHGLLQVVDKRLSEVWKNREHCPKIVRQIAVFGVVSIVWVFFRSTSIGDAIYVLTHCMEGIGNVGNYFHLDFLAFGINTMQLLLLLTFMLFVFCVELREERGKSVLCNPVLIIIVFELALFYYMRYGTDSSAFIYLQF